MNQQCKSKDINHTKKRTSKDGYWSRYFLCWSLGKNKKADCSMHFMLIGKSNLELEIWSTMICCPLVVNVPNYMKGKIQYPSSIMVLTWTRIYLSYCTNKIKKLSLSQHTVCLVTEKETILHHKIIHQVPMEQCVLEKLTQVWRWEVL